MLLRYRTVDKRQINPETDTAPTWVHPEYLFWQGEYQMLRDAAAGEKDVKARRTGYLPQLSGMDDDEYDAYLDRATYYNFTGRTISALVGTLFRRRVVLDGIPTRLLERLEQLGKDGSSFTSFAKVTAHEIMTLGREGVLVDMPAQASTDPQPYLIHYQAENILDWDDTSVQDPKTGRNILSKVVLREFKRVTKDVGGTKSQVYAARYRELLLVPVPATTGQNFEYWQNVYESPDDDAEYLNEKQKTSTRILRTGTPLDYIPFHFFGGIASGQAAIEKPPLMDIARLNISHFRSYAHLEHARFFTGLPVYYVETDGSETDDFVIGPSKVWLVPQGHKPGLLEFNGQGLKFLENALNHKEAHAAALGGRMIGVTPQSTSESDNQTKLKERNEQSLLLNTAHGLDEGFTKLLRIWAWMAGATREEAAQITVAFNKDFLFDGIGSREFRAIHSMYKDGVLPVDVVFEYLRKAEVIPDWMNLEEFKKKLKDLESFPNQPDAEARAEGFTTRQQQIGAEDKDDELDIEQQLADTLQQEADDTAKKDAEAAKTAKIIAKKPAPAPIAGKPPIVGKPPISVKK